MSELTDVLNASIDIKRMMDEVLDKAAVIASMSLDRQPAEEVRLQIEVEGCTIGSGLVSFDGSTTEQVAFTENGIDVSTKGFTNVSGITVIGISDGFITIRAVSKLGQNVNQEVSIYAGMSTMFYPLSGRAKEILMMATGQKDISIYKFMAPPANIIKRNDLVYAVSGIQGLTRGQVDSVNEIVDLDGNTHHVECNVLGL